MALVAQWKFEETSTTTCSDSENSNDLTIGGGDDMSTMATTGPGGTYLKAIELNGTDDYLSSLAALNLSGTDAVTVSAWMYEDNVGGTIWESLCEHDTDYSSVTTGFNLASNGGTFDRVRTSLRGDIGFSKSEFTRHAEGEWFFSVTVMDKGLAADEADGYYLNAVKQTNVSQANDSNNTNSFGSHTFFVGVRGDLVDNYYNGKIAGLQIHDTALDQTAIDALYAEGAPQNSVAPTVIGSIAINSELTRTTGTWGDGAETAIQWVIADDSSGTGAANISGETLSEYSLTGDDAGKYIAVDVTFANDNGSTTQRSSYVGPILSNFTYKNLTDESVAYFRLNENGAGTLAFNEAGTDGTYTNLVPSSATVDGLTPNSLSAISFDGVNQYVDAGDDDAYSFGDGSTDSPFTISGWVNASAGGSIVEKSNGAGTKEYTLGFNGGSNLYFMVSDYSATARIGRVANGMTPFGTTYHIAATYDGSGTSAGLKLYADGVRVDNLDYNHNSYTAMENTAGSLTVARTNSDLGTYLTGIVDEVLLIPRALPAEEIVTLFEDKPRLSYTQLVEESIAHFPLDETSGIIVNNTVGADGTATNMDLADPYDVQDRALDFDGINGRVDCGFPLSAPAAYTQSIWFKSSASSASQVFGTWQGSNVGYMISVSGPGLGYVLQVYSDSNVISSAATVADDVWHHLAATHDGATLTGYLDGASIGTPVSCPAPTSSGTELYIGTTAGSYTDSLLKDARLYSRALTPAEIASLADESLCSTTLLDDASLVAAWPLEESAVGTHYDISGNGNDGTAAGGVTLDTTAEFSINLDNGLTISGTDHIPQDFSNPGFDVLGSALTHPTPRHEPGLLPNSPSAARFNGTDQRVTASLTGPGYPLTMSGWCKVDTNASDRHTIVSLSHSGDATQYFGMDYRVSTSKFRVSRRNTGAVVTSSTDSTYTIGDIHHVVAVMDNATSLEIYVDGVLDFDETVTSVTFSSDSIDIGNMREPNPLWYMDGVVDEVLIFDRALDIEEIQTLNEDKPRLDSSYAQLKNEAIAYFPLDDQSGTAVKNLAGGDALAVNMDLALTNVPGLHQQTNTATLFDGVDQYISAPGVPDLSGDSSFSMWISTTETTLRTPLAVRSSGSNPGEQILAILNLSGSGSNTVSYRVGGVSATAVDASVFDGSPHHIAGTKSGTDMKLFIDGEEVDTATGGAMTGGIAYASIGSNNNGTVGTSQFFHGTLDEIMLFDKALSAIEVRLLSQIPSERTGRMQQRLAHSLQLLIERGLETSQRQ